MRAGLAVAHTHQWTWSVRRPGSNPGALGWKAATMDEQARQRRRAEAHRSVRRRRLIAAGAGVVVLALGSILVVVAGEGRGGGRQTHTGGVAARRQARLITLFGGGRQIFPAHRVVAYYGAPGDARLGILGAAPPDRIARLLKHQARAYARLGRPVLPALELVATVATRSPGADGMYSSRQPAAVVRRYLNAARRARALLILDLQPGRSEFLTEARVYESFLRDPDVSLALDPEWQLAPGQTPGQQIGSTDAATINQVSAYLARIVAKGRLPQKLLIIHQFTSDMIRRRDQIRRRPGLAITINIDGFGDRPNKIARYRALSTSPHLYHGLKLFYQQDPQLMTPHQVLRLVPRPLLVVYQ